MPSRVTVIMNASAGAADKEALAVTLKDAFGSAGVDARIVLVRHGEKIGDVARRALDERPDVIVAGGGDGTMNAVAATLVGTDIAMGVLPLGTLNHFAKDLRIPLDLDEAVRNIVAGHVVNVDVGEVNGRIFVNNSSLGIYPRIVRDREQQQRMGRGKWVAFAWSVLAVLRRHSFLSVRVAAGSQEHMARTPFVFIGNNEYQMEGFAMGTRDRLDEGRLSVYMVHHAHRWGLLRLALRALFGRLRQAKDFEAFCVPQFLVETRHKRMNVAMDGEVTWMDMPLRYQVRPGALRVIVPAPVAPAGGE